MHILNDENINTIFQSIKMSSKKADISSTSIFNVDGDEPIKFDQDLLSLKCTKVIPNQGSSWKIQYNGKDIEISAKESRVTYGFGAPRIDMNKFKTGNIAQEFSKFPIAIMNICDREPGAKPGEDKLVPNDKLYDFTENVLRPAVIHKIFLMKSSIGSLDSYESESMIDKLKVKHICAYPKKEIAPGKTIDDTTKCTRINLNLPIEFSSVKYTCAKAEGLEDSYVFAAPLDTKSFSIYKKEGGSVKDITPKNGKDIGLFDYNKEKNYLTSKKSTHRIPYSNISFRMKVKGMWSTTKDDFSWQCVLTRAIVDPIDSSETDDFIKEMNLTVVDSTETATPAAAAPIETKRNIVYEEEQDEVFCGDV